MRYAEETFNLQDICQFSTEVDMVPGLDLQPFSIILELYFVQSTTIKESDFTSPTLQEVNNEFKCLH